MTDKKIKNYKEHKARHIELHRSLDELFADFIAHSGGHTFINRPIIELIEWSSAQTQEPDHQPN